MSWIGVDLDGTLAYYDGWKGPSHIGEPIPLMVSRVKGWIASGKDVRIFTARAWAWEYLYGAPKHGDDYEKIIKPIEDWCQQHLGQVLPVTCIKDLACMEIWDDRAVAVEINTGRCAGFMSEEQQ